MRLRFIMLFFVIGLVTVIAGSMDMFGLNLATAQIISLVFIGLMLVTFIIDVMSKNRNENP